MSRRGTGGGGGLTAPDADADAEAAALEAGDPFLPSALRALRSACWCRDSATDSSSLASISVVRVSSSGAGFVEWMYDWTDREAARHRSQNSFMSSLSSTSVAGVDSTNWVRSLAEVFASEMRAVNSSGGGSVRPGARGGCGKFCAVS